jgi:PPOX class probable F420-dependent enzyme
MRSSGSRFEANKGAKRRRTTEEAMLDTAQPYHAHIDRRLRTEPIIWLVTSSATGRPHMVPMWFLWDGRMILLFSLPNTRKLRNIAANSSVVLALEAANQGYDVVIVEGRGTFSDDPLINGAMPAFVEKYVSVPRRWPPEEWAQKFSRTIQVTPTKLTAWKTKPGDPPEYRLIRF